MIEQATLKIRLVVEKQARYAVHDAERELAHAEIAVDAVGAGIAVIDFKSYCIQKRIFRRPETRVGNENIGFSRDCTGIDLVVFFVNAHKQSSIRRIDRLDMQRTAVDVGRHMYLLKAACRYRLQPDRLPDAGRRRVPEAVRLERLLAAVLPAGVRRVIDHDDERIILFTHNICDVRKKRIISACMRADARAVDIYAAFPVHRAKMQQTAFAVEPLVQ